MWLQKIGLPYTKLCVECTNETFENLGSLEVEENEDENESKNKEIAKILTKI